MRNKRDICNRSYYIFSLIIAAITGGIAVLWLQLWKRQIIRQTLLNMREFQGNN